MKRLRQEAEDFMKNDRIHTAKLMSLYQGVVSTHADFHTPNILHFDGFTKFVNNFLMDFRKHAFKELLGSTIRTEITFKKFVLYLYCLCILRSRRHQIRGASETKFMTFLKNLYDTKAYKSYLSKIPNIIWNQNEEVRSIIQKHYTVLAKIFCHYGKFDFEDLYNDLYVNKSNTIKLGNVRAFLLDFEIFPNRVSSLVMENIYKSVFQLERRELLKQAKQNQQNKKINVRFANFNEVKKNMTYQKFLNYFTRLAIFVFSQPSKNISHPNPEDKVKLFFREISRKYKKEFKKTIISELIHPSEIKAPEIISVDPQQAMCDGNIEFTLNGKNFDRRLGGVYISFDNSIMRGAISINRTQDQCTCLLPSTSDIGRDTEIRIKIKSLTQKLQYKIQIESFLEVEIRGTNDRKKFSEAVKFTYCDQMPAIFVAAEITSSLFGTFKRYCKYHDRENTGRMSKKKFQILIEDIMRVVKRFNFQGKADLTSLFDKYCTREEEGVQNEGGGLSTTFLSLYLTKEQYMTALVDFCLFDLLDVHPQDFLIVVSQARLFPKKKTKTNLEQYEDKAYREMIGRTLLRRTRGLDIYLGPMLVGQVQDKPGKIRTLKYNEKEKRKYEAGVVRNHSFSIQKQQQKKKLKPGNRIFSVTTGLRNYRYQKKEEKRLTRGYSTTIESLENLMKEEDEYKIKSKIKKEEKKKKRIKSYSSFLSEDEYLEEESEDEDELSSIFEDSPGASIGDDMSALGRRGAGNISPSIDALMSRNTSYNFSREDFLNLQTSEDFMKRQNIRGMGIFGGLGGKPNNWNDDIGPFFYHVSRNHDFLEYVQIERSTQTLVTDEIAFCESFEDFVNRLIKKGFDVNASFGSSKGTRKPAGRCWEVRLFEGGQEKVASIWDYPGHFCTIHFLPVEECSPFSKEFTITVYNEDYEARMYHYFRRSNNIAELREMISRSGDLFLRTKLFLNIKNIHSLKKSENE